MTRPDTTCLAQVVTPKALVFGFGTGLLLSRAPNCSAHRQLEANDLGADGEKPWRHRDTELESRRASRSEIVEKWERGWDIPFAALGDLADEDLSRMVTIHGIPVRVDAALLRSMAQVVCHVGQIACLGRRFRGAEWEYLTIPPRPSATYNENPILEATGNRKTTREIER